MLTTQRAPAHYAIIDAAELAATTKLQYRRAIDRLIAAQVDPRNRSQLGAYAKELPQSGRAFLKAALKLLWSEYSTHLKSQATPDNLAEIQAALLNIDAMAQAIKVRPTKGTRSHLWLTPAQILQLTALPDRSTPIGRRDWIALALMVSAGLRREEAVSLTFDRLKYIPNDRNERIPVLDITGKGAKDRTVPISHTLADAILQWREEAGDGKILRSVDNTGRVNHSLTGKSVYQIVLKYGAMLEMPELRPHDLRRSYGMIIYNSTKDLTLVMTRLGHNSPQTTVRYLDLKLNLNADTAALIPLS